MRFGSATAPSARLVPVPGGLAFISSYDVGLVNAFKAMIPAESRKWDPLARRWLVAPQYGPLCAQLAEQYLGVLLLVPPAPLAAQPETRLLRVDYLGRCKDRGGPEPTAFGQSGGDWSVIIPQSVLLTWFQAEPVTPDRPATLYALLGIAAIAMADEIRSAHRRLALQWHPDRCKEPNAVEQFKQIQRAYTVLSDPLKRKKYDAGLALEASARQHEELLSRRPLYLDDDYQPPLRCGYLLVDGEEAIGRFVVSAILGWEDVQDEQGRVMVSSWPKDAKTYQVEWC